MSQENQDCYAVKKAYQTRASNIAKADTPEVKEILRVIEHKLAEASHHEEMVMSQSHVKEMTHTESLSKSQG